PRLRQRRALDEPGAQGLERVAPHRHDALAAALAHDAHARVVEVESREVELRELREPEARRIEELEDRAVAGDDRAVAANVEQLRHAIRIQRARKPLADLRRAHARCRVRAKLLLAHEETAAAPQRGKPARDAAGAESAAKAGGGEGPYVPVVHALPARDAGALAVVDEGVEVAAIVQAGVRREAPLVFQVIYEAVNQVTHQTE